MRWQSSVSAMPRAHSGDWWGGGLAGGKERRATSLQSQISDMKRPEGELVI